LIRHGNAPASGWTSPDGLLLTLAFALLVAPWLTMVGRNPLGGIVFSIAIPAVILVIGDVIGAAWYGASAAVAIDLFKWRLFWLSMIALAVTGAVSSWWMFLRLEAIEGRGQDMTWRLDRVSTPATRSTRTRRHPMLHLVVKELRLQPLSFVVAALYVLGWIGVLIADRLNPEFADPSFVPVAALYAGVVALIIGALASAEERQFGTLESQLLLPIAAWQQWTIKAATCCGLAIALGVGSTLTVAAVFAQFSTHPEYYRLIMASPAGALGLTALSALVATIALYVSTTCATGLRAIVLSLPAVFVSYPIVKAASVATLLVLAPSASGTARVTPAVQTTAAAIILAVFIAIILSLAGRNHRALDRRPSRIAGQVVALLILAIAGNVILTLLRR
jgi:hypothetical protein